MAKHHSKDGKPLSYIFTSPADISNKTDKALADGILKQFPIENKDYRLELHNVHVDKKEFDLKDEKEAILRSRSLTYPVKGDLVLYDKATEKVVDTEKNFSLADSFAVTGKHTMLYNGNNYAVANLLLLQPGVYHRYKSNDELMAQFNNAQGSNFEIQLFPKSQEFILSASGSNIPAAYVLKEIFGVDEQEASKYIPAPVWKQNVAEYSGKEERYLNQLFNKIVPARTKKLVPNPDSAVKKQMIHDSFTNSKLDPETTKITLGKSHSNVSAEAILTSMANLVKIHKGERSEDNRDSLQFKRVNNLPDFIARRFAENKEHETVRAIKTKLKFNLEKLDKETPKIKSAIPSKPFNKVMQKFITESTLSFTPSETNPVESLETVAKVTVLGPGEGGIDIKKAKSVKTRNIDPTHLGIIDPSRTPESENAGVDLRFTINSARDDDGKMYARVINSAGKFSYLSAQEIMEHVIGFPHQEDSGDTVQAQAKGMLKNVKRSEVEYWLPAASDMYTVTTNLVPFINSNHPGRLTMAGKALTQALSLQNREAPLVRTVQGQVKGKEKSYVSMLGTIFGTQSPVDGTVKSISGTEIKITDEKGTTYKVPFVKNLPFNQKGFIDDETPLVKVGDRVHKGQVLIDNNYMKNGDLAIGKNLNVAYMPFEGFNHEDGIVIRQGAAESLNSLHSYKYDYTMKMDTVDSKALFRKWFPNLFTPMQLSTLDERGFIKEGTKLRKGDPIWAMLEKRSPTAEDRMFGKLHKILVKPFNQVVEYWNHEEPGEVVDVHTDTKNIRVMVRSIKPLEIGDKLTGLHGNKGIVSLILPDSKMPYNKDTGEPVDLVLNPASVTSRINLGQVMETAAGRIARHTGEPYMVKNYGSKDNLKQLKSELAHHGLKDSDVLVDPSTGKDLGSVFGGPQYILKLYKTTDSNYAARNAGGYDSFLQPTKGGEEGSKRSAYMEFLGLIGNDARKNLKEIGTIKSEQNDEFWWKFMNGQPLPKPKTTFATTKFFDYLRASGIDVRHEQDKVRLAPMTDQKILQMSNGALKPFRFNARSMEPDKGGLFDIAITGGPSGSKWGHYSLAEPIVNPIFEAPVKSILGLSAGEYDGLIEGSMGVQKHPEGHFELYDTKTKKKLRDIHTNEEIVPKQKLVKKADGEESGYSDSNILVGGRAFHALLGTVSTEEGLKRSVSNAAKATSISRREKEIKKAKYLGGLKETGFKTAADAYILNHIPVIPPLMRPAIDQGGNNIQFADTNQLYVDHMTLNDSLKEGQLLDLLPPEEVVNQRRDLYNGAAALVGIGEPIGPKKQLKGFIRQIAGEGGPKTGMFHDRLLSKKQDFSGRATIYASPDVKFNEAKVPIDQLWTMYKMHIIRDLVRSGFDIAKAKQAWEKRDPAATNSFNKTTKEVPILINRAPTLMRTNIMAVYPVPVVGKTVGLNILHLPGFAADFDGDAMTMYVPMTPEAVQEAKDRLLPMHHLSDARRGHGVPMFAPGHEAILGSVHLTEADTSKKTIEYETEEEALKDFHAGKIDANQPIRIKAKA